MAFPTSAQVKGASVITGDNMDYTSRNFIGAVEDEWQLYSDNASDYTIGSPIGFGASSIVYAATFQPQPSESIPAPPPIRCALKVLDLDSLPLRSLSLLQRETTLMSLSKHPNVLRVRGSWMDGHKLYIALRLMNKGSAADVMRYGWPGGMEEDVVRCVLRQALQGLNYLHINGFIHRDVKAANLLIDDDGTVLLGDLGVAANLAEDSSQRFESTKSGDAHNSSKPIMALNTTGAILLRPKVGKRKSFVGTPCWMAPELIQGRQYDSSADIWSFGITALELTQGRPPRSRESPQRVLLKTIQEAPPMLDRDGGAHKYSRAFKEIVEKCLIKDPSMRPTAEELLQSPFFKASKKKSYLVGAILKNLPPLTQRQERRVANHAQTYRSVDSWDFATTLHTPTSTYYRRPLEVIDLIEQPDTGDVQATVNDQSKSEDMDSKHASLSNDFDFGADEIETTDKVFLSSSPSNSEGLDYTSSAPSPASSYSPPSSIAESVPTVVKSRISSVPPVPSTTLPMVTRNPDPLSAINVVQNVDPHVSMKRSLWNKIKKVRRMSSRSDSIATHEKNAQLYGR